MSNINKMLTVYMEGSFKAIAPFDKLVKEDTNYKVTAVRTISDIIQAKIDPYTLVYQKVGFAKEDADTAITKLNESNGDIVTLSSLNGDPVHVPSNYIASFPMVDGAIYERICMYIDLGAVPAELENSINTFRDDVADMVKARIGITTAKVALGTIRTKSYVSKEQAELFEIARKNQITDNESNAAKILRLEEQAIKDAKYIATLEEALKATVKTT